MEQKIGFCTSTDGARIAYATVGEGPGLVIIPGWISNVQKSWEEPEVRRFYESLALHHTLVHYDQRGNGLSDRNRTDFTLESDCQDLETVIDHLKLERLALFGLSLGGPVGIMYTARHSERVSHLILYDTFARGEAIGTDEVKKAFVSLVRAHWGIGSKTLADLFFPGASPTMVENFSKYQREGATPEMAVQLLGCVFKTDVAPICSNIQAPTLVLHRQHDHVVPFRLGRELASLIPNASFVPLEGDIHLPHFGDSMSVLRNIAGFLGDPVPKEFAGDTDGKVVPLSNLVEPKTEQKKVNWLRLDHPLVYIFATVLASVIAGIILTLFKC